MICDTTIHQQPPNNPIPINNNPCFTYNTDRNDLSHNLPQQHNQQPPNSPQSPTTCSSTPAHVLVALPSTQTLKDSSDPTWRHPDGN
mmetsp:Transcript_65/g.142  ORF Transcript_65/g.142 Transcript_65/m.142 type:complete len:87 (-) Transcript_65:1881-2141(-)